MHISNSTSLDPPLAINYDNYQKSLAYRNFSHLAPLICSFLRKDIVKRGKEGQGHCTMSSSIITLLTIRKSITVMNYKFCKFFMHKSVRINSVWMRDKKEFLYFIDISTLLDLRRLNCAKEQPKKLSLELASRSLSVSLLVEVSGALLVVICLVSCNFILVSICLISLNKIMKCDSKSCRVGAKLFDAVGKL